MACRLTERPTFTPSWFLSGLIAVVTKSGGAHGFADIIVKKIRSRRGAEIFIFFLGFGEGDSYGSILWGAFLGSMVIWVMTALQYKQGGKIVNQWKY